MKTLSTLFNSYLSKFVMLAVVFISAANVGQSQVLLNEDFSAGVLPTGWTESSVSFGDNWEYGGSVDFGSTSTINDPFGNSGEYAHIDFSDDPDTTSIITPIVDISTLTTPRLTFYYISQTTSTSFSPYNRLIVDYWDGVAWVNITVIDSLTTAGWTEYDFNISTYTFGTDSVQFRFSAQEGGAAIGGTGTFTFDQDLALDDVTIEETPTCLAPTGVVASTVLDTSITFSWTENNAATQWEIEWETTDNYSIGTTNTSIINTDTFAILNGLSPATDYTFRVRAICTVGDTSQWAIPTTALTLCPASFSTPFSEDFNALTLPVCWSQGAGNSEDWEFQLTDGHIGNVGNQGSGSTVSGGGLASVDDSSPHNTNTTLESPFIDVSGLTSPRLTFFTISDNEGNLNGNVDFHVDVYDGANWNDSIFFSDTNTVGGTWEKIIVDLSSLTITGPIQVRFVVDENNGTLFDDDRAIDDVVVEETPSCIAPANLVASTTLDTSITFSWTENNAATQWEIEWETDSNYNAGTRNISIVNTDTFIVLNGLTPITDYTFRVRAICAIGDTSSWTAPLTVKTICPASFTAPLFYDFENEELDAPPACWLEYESYTNGFVEVEDFTGTAAPFEGNKALYIYSSSGFTQGSDTLIAITPRLSDLSAGDKQIRFQANSDDPITQLIIGTIASPTPSSTFNGIDTITFATPDTYQEVIVPFNTLNGYNGTDEYIVFAHNLGATFDYIRIDNLYYEDIPSCPKPTAPSFSATTDSSVVISWTNGGTETEWEIEYDTAGFIPGTGKTKITTTNPDTITGLQSATTYDFYIRAVCTVGDSSIFTNALTGSTRITPAQGVSCTSGSSALVFSDDLESTNGWTGDIGTGSSLEQWNYDASGTTSNNTGPSAAYSGTQYVYVETSGASVGDSVSFISPAIDLTNANDFAELSFWLHAYGADIGTLNVGVGTSATGPFTNEFSYTGEVQSDELDPFENVGVNLDAYVGQTIYIEFLYITNGSFEGDIALDLIEVTSCLPCPVPSNLASTNITSNSADLNWTDSTANQWIIEYDTAGFSQGSGANSMVVDTTTFATLTGLSPQTAYDFYVRAICSPGDTSAYSVSSSFTTLVCSDPTALSSTNLSADSATLSWTENGTAMQWEISYGSTGFTAGNGTQVVANSNPFDLLNLNSNTSYDWYVRSICGPGDTSIWSDTASFTTLAIPIPYYPIGTINGEDSIGVADSLNVSCYTSGTVTGVDRRGGGYEFALIDLSSGVQEGITVFDFNDLTNYTAPSEGDSLEIYGSVGQFNGLTQFRPDSIIVLQTGTGTVATPIQVNVLDETTESKLIELSDNFVLLDPSGTFSYNMDATNGIDTITIRVDSDTDVNDSLNVATNGLVAGDTICGLIGIGGQFDNSSPYTEGYQVFPSRYSDLTICRLSVGLNNVEVKTATFSIVPNPTSGDFIIRTNGFKNESVRIQIRDISGRIVANELLSNANNQINKTMNLNGNAKGIYFINIYDGENVIHKKLILR